MNVAIVGAGYVGLTTGVCLAYLGHNVSCVDSDRAKISSLNAGEIPFYEPHLAELSAEAQANLHFTTCYEQAVGNAQIVFIAVGTPVSACGTPDLQYVEAAARSIGENLGPQFTVIVNKSTVPIGCGHWVESLVRAAFENKNGASVESDFSIASNPEFLREGSAIFDTLYPDRVVIGTDDRRTAELLECLYKPVRAQNFRAPVSVPRPERMAEVPLISTDLASAELIKYAANAFLALKISYINEIGQLAEKVGADIGQISLGIGLDGRIGRRFLQAGVGWGGSCFGKDTAALISTASEYGLDSTIVKAARAVNQRQRERVIEKLLAELKILKGRTIGLLGLSFKPHTDDLREAPAIEIARKLLERGAHVKAHDPVSMEKFKRQNSGLKLICCASPCEVVRGADAVVMLTEWPEYRELDWEALHPTMKQAVVLDGRNQLDRAAMARLGYRCLGLAG